MSVLRARPRTQSLRALFLSPAAQAWLNRTTSARVLHAFQRACNLVNSGGEILALVTPEIGPGPFAIVAPPLSSCRVETGFSSFIEPRSEVIVHEGLLEVGPLALDTRRASLWQPRPAWERLRGQPDALKAQLPALKALLASHAPAGSLAALVASRPADHASETDATFQARLLQAARRPAETLCNGVLAEDLEACRAGAGMLAGLGGGLTPAGDDFLLGVLYALWATRPPQQAAALADAIAARAVPRTSRLSAAWLKAAARGEAARPWHTLVEALVCADQTAVVAAARGILRVGHTSGSDALAGFVCALNRP